MLSPVHVTSRDPWPRGAVAPTATPTAQLNAHLDAAKALLECYLGAGNATVAPTSERVVGGDGGRARHFRTIHSEFFVFGHDLALNARALRDDGAVPEDAIVVYAVAPHLFYDDGPGVAGKAVERRRFVAPVDRPPDDVQASEEEGPGAVLEDHRPSPAAFAVSTGAPTFFNDVAMRRRVFAATVLSAFCFGAGCEPCENDCCACNPISCFGDLGSHSLLLCPSCFRRLDLNGTVHDVDAILKALAVHLQSDALRPVSSRDLNKLNAWGYVDLAKPPNVVDLSQVPT